MTHETETQRTEIVQPPVAGHSPSYGYYDQKDEISLFDLWNGLVKRKYIILLLTAITTIGAFIFALSAPPVYKAEAVFLPPTASDIQELKIQNGQELNIESVYATFKHSLISRAPRQAVFEKMNLLEKFAPGQNKDNGIEAIFDEFNKNISVTFPAQNGKAPIQKTTLGLVGKDPKLIAEILNQVARQTLIFSTKEIITNIHTEISVRVNNLNSEIELLRKKVKKQCLDEIERLETTDTIKRKMIEDEIAVLKEKKKKERLARITRLEEADRIKRESIKEKINTIRLSARTRRLDRIAKLKEASSIAHLLGIKDPIMTNISTNDQQLYKMGFEALDTEINSLINRKDDDPFITGLRGFQDQLKELEVNEKIEALKERSDDSDFIPELFDLQEQLELLQNNRKAQQLKARKNDDPFILTLRDKQSEIKRLELINIDPTRVKTARLDQAAYPPKYRIKPKRKQIVIIGFMLGLSFGVIGAFLSSIFTNLREERQ